MDVLGSIGLGVGLSAACGFRVFVPLLVTSILGVTGWVPLVSEGTGWIATWPALITFASATVLEGLGYLIPWLDHLLDSVATPAAVVAGVLVSAYMHCYLYFWGGYRGISIDTYQALIYSNFSFTVPFTVWMLVGYFESIPRELEEAALVDGASRTAALTRVLLPLAAPGIVASAIFAFTLSWNEFLYALVFIQDETAITVPVGLNLLIYGDVFHWGQLMAASVITTVPVVVLYMFVHRWMVEGLASGSVKG